MQTVGNYLKSGREAKNISLSEVSRTTKISKWYLDCLEQDDFDKMPGGPYIKGYISSYAAFIGIEEDEVLKRYDSLQSNSTNDNQTQNGLQNDKKRQSYSGIWLNRKKTIILGLAILSFVALGTYFFLPQNQGPAHFLAKISDLKGGPEPGIDASKAENRFSALTSDQKFAPAVDQKSLPENKELPAETDVYIQGASTSATPILEAFPPAEKHVAPPVIDREPASAPGSDRTRTAGQELEPAGYQTQPIALQAEKHVAPPVIDREPASAPGWDRTRTAGQELEPAGYQTQATAPQAQKLVAPPVIDREPASAPGWDRTRTAGQESEPAGYQTQATALQAQKLVAPPVIDREPASVPGWDRTGTAGQELEPAGYQTQATAPQAQKHAAPPVIAREPASAPGWDRTRTADQELEPAGYQTQPTAPQAEQYVAPPVIASEPASVPGWHRTRTAGQELEPAGYQTQSIALQAQKLVAPPVIASEPASVPGWDRTRTAGQESEPAGYQTQATAPQAQKHAAPPVIAREPASAPGWDRTGTAGQELEPTGYQTQPTPPQAAGNIKVVEAMASSGIANRAPIGTGKAFEWTMDRVYIWTVIESESHPSSIRHIYFFKGQKVSDIELEIRSSQWRTWSYKTLLDKRYIGPWSVNITSAEGKLLQRIQFEVN